MVSKLYVHMYVHILAKPDIPATEPEYGEEAERKMLPPLSLPLPLLLVLEEGEHHKTLYYWHSGEPPGFNVYFSHLSRHPPSLSLTGRGLLRVIKRSWEGKWGKELLPVGRQADQALPLRPAPLHSN